MAKRLSELNVLEKISRLSPTLDNAAPNDVLIRALSRILREKYDIQFVPENSQIRCLAHVVNLVVQKILAALNEADEPEVMDYYLPNKDLPFHYEPEEDPNLRDLENERFEAEADKSDEEDADAETMSDMATELANLSPLQKLRLTTTKICGSPQRRRRFHNIATSLYKDEVNGSSGRKLSTLMVIRDVKHRWNFTEAMISRGKLLRKAIDQWVLEREELRPLLLTHEQWKLLEALGDILRVRLVAYITGETASTWDDFVQKNKDVARFRNKGWVHLAAVAPFMAGKPPKGTHVFRVSQGVVPLPSARQSPRPPDSTYLSEFADQSTLSTSFDFGRQLTNTSIAWPITEPSATNLLLNMKDNAGTTQTSTPFPVLSGSNPGSSRGSVSNLSPSRSGSKFTSKVTSTPMSTPAASTPISTPRVLLNHQARVVVRPDNASPPASPAQSPRLPSANLKVRVIKFYTTTAHSRDAE
ncbi:hypothetical protein B0H10DRAFT_2239418 [Mycena sp. CBHHK59/15]|nr:hypothetical protein B0H10DRAFT_2239418 [Mycena sp. CBHHK59/15]